MREKSILTDAVDSTKGEDKDNGDTTTPTNPSTDTGDNGGSDSELE